MEEDKQTIARLREKANEYRKLASSFEMVADQLEKDITISREGVLIRTKFPSGRNVKSDKITFKSAILNLFEDGMPKTTRQLMVAYNESANRKLEFTSFSGRFSIIVNKGFIKKHQIKNNPLEKRFYYGKPEWFDGNKLKNEYFEKII
jgi:peroxiredoxin